MQSEKKSPFPYNMIEGMMPFFPHIAVMGWVIVMLAFLVGIFVLSPAQATFFSDAKAVREGAAIGSELVRANVTTHVTEAWLPQFKFFGLGLGLMAIVMALGLIARRLRLMGMTMASHMPEAMRPETPPIPARRRVFQWSTVIGIMVLLAVLIIGIVYAVDVVPSYWNHSIANELNAAAEGSTLLSQLGTVSSFSNWLNPLRMIGMAFLFTAITLALTIIIGTLRKQANMLVMFYQKASGS